MKYLITLLLGDVILIGLFQVFIHLYDRYMDVEILKIIKSLLYVLIAIWFIFNILLIPLAMPKF